MNIAQRNQKAISLAAEGKHSEAHSEFLDIIKLSPKNSDAWLNLGVCRNTLGEIQAAKEAFQQAIHYNPYSIAAYTNLASTWVSLSNIKAALAVLEQGLQLVSNNPKLMATKGALLAQYGDISQALHLLEKAHDLAPNDFSIALIISELLVQQQRFLEALSLLKRKDWSPNRFVTRYYLALGRAYYGCRDMASALSVLSSIEDIEAQQLLQEVERGWVTPIESKRIYMEPLRDIHAKHLLELYEDLKGWSYYNPQGVMASNLSALEQEIHRRYEYPNLPPNELAWAIFYRNDNEFIFIGLGQLVNIDHPNKRAELLMMLQDQHRGYAAESLLLMANRFFNNYGFNKLITLVLDNNPTVLEMLLRLDFMQEGYLQQHLYEPNTKNYYGIYSLALFKKNYEESTILQNLKKRFRI